MLVNCENSKTRLPSSISSGSIPIKSPSLAEAEGSPISPEGRLKAGEDTLDAAGSLTRRGSQQTWRSLSRASRIMIWLCDTPRVASTCRSFLSKIRRSDSYISRCSPVSSTQRTTSVLGGNSASTCSFVRRKRKGRTRSASCCRRSASFCFSIGVRKAAAKRRTSPSRPGIRKLYCAQSSPRWFSSGVPVSDRR